MSSTLVKLQGDPSRWSVSITRETIQRILHEPHGGDSGDLIALWMFYAYTARWQKTNRPKCTTQFVATGLHWTEKRVKRAKSKLADMGLIEQVNTKDAKGKIVGWYIEVFYFASSVQKGDFAPSGESTHKCSRSKKINTLGVNKSKDDIICDDAVEPKWKPEDKQRQLSRIKVPAYPSQMQFDEYCEDADLCNITDKRPDLYAELCNHKWHEWRSDFNRWIPIRDWRAYVEALDAKIEECNP